MNDGSRDRTLNNTRWADHRPCSYAVILRATPARTPGGGRTGADRRRLARSWRRLSNARASATHCRPRYTTTGHIPRSGKSGDGGIDGLGVCRLGLVSFPVFFQCKPYRGSVSPGAVRDFRGAMAGRGDKGLLNRSSVRFRQAAQVEATFRTNRTRQWGYRGDYPQAARPLARANHQAPDPGQPGIAGVGRVTPTSVTMSCTVFPAGASPESSHSMVRS